MMSLFQEVHRQGTTVILVTHDMSLVLNYCDRVVVMDDGKIAEIGTPVSLFKGEIEKYSLQTPTIFEFAKSLNARGFSLDLERITNIETLAKQIAERKRK